MTVVSEMIKTVNIAVATQWSTLSMNTQIQDSQIYIIKLDAIDLLRSTKEKSRNESIKAILTNLNDRRNFTCKM